MVKVTVIVPTYNRRDLLRAALESVYVQTFSDFEIIVADDGSTDGTAEDFTSPSGRMTTYLALPHSGLPAVARNEGVALAKGDYIAFLDSDDMWTADKLMTQVAAMDDNPDLGLICSNATVVRSGSDDTRLFHPPGLQVPRRATERLLKSNFVITSTAMVRRSALGEGRPFSEDPSLRGMEDYDLWLRISKEKEVLYQDLPLAVYLDQATSVRSENSRRRHWEGMLKVYSRLRTEAGVMEEFRHSLADAEFEARYQIGQGVRREKGLRTALKPFASLLIRSPTRLVKRVGYDLIRK